MCAPCPRWLGAHWGRMVVGGADDVDEVDVDTDGAIKERREPTAMPA